MEANDYCSYELSLALKKAGFDLEVNHVYDKNGELWEEGMNENAECDYTAYFNYNKSGYIEVSASAPTLAQAQKWLREKKHLIVLVDYILITKDAANRWCFSVSDTYGLCDTDKDHKRYNSYEEALSAGIAAALDFLDNEKE